MRRLLGLAIAAAVATALFALTAGQAFGNHVQCGDVITQDTTLDSDLNCPRHGLYVVSGATLDLGGHTISGPGIGQCHIEYPGTCVFTGVRGPGTVRNGTIRGWDRGVGSDPTAISGVTITDTQVAIEGQLERVIGNTLKNNAIGMVLWASDLGQGLVRDNSISGSAGDGINVLSAEGSMVFERNSLFDNGGNGISVSEAKSDANVIMRKNRIDHNAADGINLGSRVFFTDVHDQSFRLEDNHIDHNGDDGIDVQDCRDLWFGFYCEIHASAVNNHLWWNADLGIEAAPGTLGGGNWAKHNGNAAQCVPGSLCSTTGKPKN